MTFTWQYPVYLIPLEGGYVSVVDPRGEEPRPHHLAVFTSEESAAAFMHHCQILGSPRSLKNAREFGWLLQSLQEPVTRVAFDPQPDSPTIESRWTVDVQELLARHLVVDYSPWNYPVFVIQQATGYASIEGRTSQGTSWAAVALFTSREKAAAYSQASGSAGTLRELSNVPQARTFLEEMVGVADAVALDPTVDGDTHAAQHCFSLATVLQKYLLSTPRPS
ncbi:MAG: hypothetical protein ACYC3X_07335 [Pirellulaceae bacterium]